MSINLIFEKLKEIEAVIKSNIISYQSLLNHLSAYNYSNHYHEVTSALNNLKVYKYFAIGNLQDLVPPMSSK